MGNVTVKCEQCGKPFSISSGMYIDLCGECCARFIDFLRDCLQLDPIERSYKKKNK